MMNWTWNQYKAAGKHAASYAAGAVTIALAWGLVSQTDAGSLTEAISHITDGIKELSKGIGMIASVIVPIYTAWRSAHNASPTQQANSLVNTVPGTFIVTNFEIANAVPSSSVMSNTEAKIVAKDAKVIPAK